MGAGSGGSVRAGRDAVASAGRRRMVPESVLRTLDWDNLAEEIEGLARRIGVNWRANCDDHRASGETREQLGARAAQRLDRHSRRDVKRPWRSCATVHRFGEKVPGLIARRTRAAVRRALGDLVGRGEMAQAAAARTKPDYTEERSLLTLPEPPASPQVRNGRRRRADA